MDSSTIRILEFLLPNGLGAKGDISDILNDIFPMNISLQDHEYGRVNGNIIRFLEEIVQFINYDSAQIQLPGKNSHPDKWFQYQFMASITKDGISFLRDIRIQEEKSIFNQSSIETNNSIKKTNISVQKTNDALLQVSKEQGKINEGIIANSRSQTEILERQTIIFFFTAVFTLGTLAVSIFTQYQDSAREALRTQLQLQSKEILSLQFQIQQLKNKHIDSARAKKK